MRLLNGLAAVQAERNSENGAAEECSPPVMPLELVKMRTGKFIEDVLDSYREHISMFWSEEKIEQLEREHQCLLSQYQSRDSWVQKAIAHHNHTTMFNDAWDDLKGQFKYLRAFAGGLATAFANTTSVESDFSILKWEKDSNRTAMSSLALEGIFQAKQYDILSKI